MKTKPWLWLWKIKNQNCDIWSCSHSCDVDLKNTMHIGSKQQTSNLFESDLVSKKSADSWCYPTFPGRRCIWKMAAQRRGADTGAQSPHLQLTGKEVLWFKPGAVFRLYSGINFFWLFGCVTLILLNCGTVILWHCCFVLLFDSVYTLILLNCGNSAKGDWRVAALE